MDDTRLESDPVPHPHPTTGNCRRESRPCRHRNYRPSRPGKGRKGWMRGRRRQPAPPGKRFRSTNETEGLFGVDKVLCRRSPGSQGPGELRSIDVALDPRSNPGGLSAAGRETTPARHGSRDKLLAENRGRLGTTACVSVVFYERSYWQTPTSGADSGRRAGGGQNEARWPRWADSRSHGRDRPGLSGCAGVQHSRKTSEGKGGRCQQRT